MFKEKKINDPIFSIIMNCHNGEKYLKQSLESIIFQNYKNWELIFWDNQSTDKSKDLFKTIKDERFKYFYSANKTSLYAARNLSIQKANGLFLTFLDTDDYWLPTKLEKQLKFFQANPHIKIVYGNYFILNEKLKTKKLACKDTDLRSGKIYENLLQRYNIGLLSICIKRNVNFRFDERFDIVGDLDAIMKLAKEETFGVIKEPLSVYRYHEKNFSLLNKEKHHKELNIWYNENIKFDNNINRKLKDKFEIDLIELKIISYLLKKKKIEAYKLISDMKILKKKIKFMIFLLLPNPILRKFINR